MDLPVSRVWGVGGGTPV